MKIRQMILLTSLSLTPLCSNAFFCPNNFNQINLGDSIETVTKACGEPDKQETKEAEVEGPQEWTYFLPQDVPVSTGYSGKALLKTTIVFDDKQEVINITVNGIGVGATTICGPNIQLGEKRERILSTCGKPAFVVKQQPFGESEQEQKAEEKTKITEFLYTTTPPSTLVFEDGILVEQK